MAIQENPYLPPASRVEDAAVPGARDGYIDGGRPVAARRGWDWITGGWRTFKQQPGTWILLVVVLGVMVILLAVIPFAGQVALPLVMPAFLGGLMLACERLERGESISLNDLFSGFQRKAGPLILLGLIGFGLSTLALIAATALTFVLSTPGRFGSGGTFEILLYLMMMAFLLPVYMALWFGPPLVVLQDVPPARAVAQSFRACLKNIIPFLVYSIILVPLAVIATLPILLGWLMLLPVIIASTYVAYRNIFFER